MTYRKSLKTISKSLSHLYVALFVLSTKMKKSLIDKLNNNSLKVCPYDKLLIMSYQSLFEEFTFVPCFRVDK